MPHHSASIVPEDESRRVFLKGAGAGVAAAVLSAGAPAPAAAHGSAEATPESRSYDEAFVRRAAELRSKLASSLADVKIPAHPTNGDERRYYNQIGTDTRGLPHNDRGEVDPAAWRAAAAAFASRDPADFEKIPLGGTRRLVNPVGTLAVSLEGLNAAQFQLPAAPALAGTERAADAIEIYWQSLLRDVPQRKIPKQFI